MCDGSFTPQQTANGLLIMFNMCALVACQYRQQDLLRLARDLVRHDAFQVRDAASGVIIGLTKMFEYYPDAYRLGITDRSEVMQDVADALELGLSEHRGRSAQDSLSRSDTWQVSIMMVRTMTSVAHDKTLSVDFDADCRGLDRCLCKG